ncbi:hypothetical protein WJU16_25610 [Chitinophaga pollutisoli]|uniref:Uncharacterized protein n=1 Tax=Chitinophaga pollutisoli TaxID=3133966 RepID=A0ABZ2YNM0_9BACT
MTYPEVPLAETSFHLLRLYIRMRRQRSAMRRRLQETLSGLLPEAPSILPQPLIQRMYHYQEIAHFVVCGALARMQGRQLTETEQIRQTLLSVITPLFDEICNNPSRNGRISELTNQPNAFVPCNESEALLREAYLRLLSQAANPAAISAQFRDVCYWREQSLRQQDADISEAELFRITYHKSYHAVLLFYTAFDCYPAPGETALAFPMAGLMQLTSDVFSIWENIRAGIYTIPILHRRYGRLEKRFMAESARFNQALLRLPYPAGRKKEYAQTVHMLHAMGLVAIRRLQSETKGVQDLSDLALLGQKRLVCKMDDWRGWIAWVSKIKELTNLMSFEGPTEKALRRSAPLSAAG